MAKNVVAWVLIGIGLMMLHATPAAFRDELLAMARGAE